MGTGNVYSAVADREIRTVFIPKSSRKYVPYVRETVTSRRRFDRR